MLLALCLLAVSAYFYRPASDAITTGDVFMLAALVAFSFSLWIHQRREGAFALMPSNPAIAGKSPHIGVIPLVVGLGALKTLSDGYGPTIHEQAGLLVLGAVGLIIGIGGVRPSHARDFVRALSAQRAEVLIVLALTLLALGLRTWNLEDAVRASMDEVPFMAGVVYLRDHLDAPLLQPMHSTSSFTRFFAYLQYWVTEFSGSSMGTLRLTSAFIGALTIPALYLLARWLFDRPAALVAVLLLATFPPHVHMSRIAINNIADPGARNGQRTRKLTYGYRRAEVVGSLINLTTLVVIGFYILAEGVSRIFDPEPIVGWAMIWVSLIALVVDVLTAVLTYRMAKTSLNIRAAFIHNVGDAWGTIGVMIAGVLVIGGYILLQGAFSMGEAIPGLMDSVPPDVDVHAIMSRLGDLDGVDEAHHVHVWELGEGYRALEAHVVVAPDMQMARIESIKGAIRTILHDEFGIEHSSLEFESSTAPYDGNPWENPQVGN